MNISVIICTHNPREDYLRRTLVALKTQTLPKEQWELLLIDNASKEPLADKWDLSWHPLGRHLREDELGLTPARLCGIREATGDVIIFVDDDNELCAEYLSVSHQVAMKYPFLGAWGAGIIEPEFEVPPPVWMSNYRYLLALRDVPTDRWSNLVDTDITLPYGAGLCVRKIVAETYVCSVANDVSRRGLDRVGNYLGCAGDLDMAQTSMDLGMGTGLFRQLAIKHFMPARRLGETYLIRLMEGNNYSGVVLSARRGRPPQIAQIGFARRILGKIRRFLTMKPRSRRFLEAQIKGQQRALQDMAALVGVGSQEVQSQPE